MLKEVKLLVTSMIGERDHTKVDDALKSISKAVDEVIMLVSSPKLDSFESKNDKNYNIKFVCDEVYNILSDKIEELESINISLERVIVKQIMLNLISNTILKTESGQVKVECMLETDPNNQAKVSASNENKAWQKGLVKQKQGNQNNQDADFSLSQRMIEKLGGKFWTEHDKFKGTTVYFTFNKENQKPEIIKPEIKKVEEPKPELVQSYDEEDMNISEFESSQEYVKKIPQCFFNNTPFVNKPNMAVEEIKISESSVNINSQVQCCPKILLVDDNYFNIEVLQSLIEVQLSFECDSAFNGLEALNKVKDRYKKTCCSNYYSFIFMDINMPIMDGYVSSSEIKSFLKKEALKINKNAKPIATKIFAVTAQKEVVENEQNVFDGIILKPISIEGLRNILNV